jgi:hypothetical protein
MPRIPQFEQRKLASSLVGTPGVDRSGEQTFNAISQASGSVANTFGEMAIKRQKAADQASADQAVTDYEIALQRAHQEHAVKYSNSAEDPKNRTNLFSDTAKELRTQFEDTLSSDQAKALFRSASVEPTRSRLLQEGKLASETQVLVTTRTLTDNLNKTALNTYENAKIPGMDYESRVQSLRSAINISAQRHITAGRGILSESELKKTAEKSVVQNFEATYNAMLETDPEQAVQLLEDPELQFVYGFMDEGEKAKKIKEAEDAVIDFSKVVQRQEQLALFTEKKALIDKLRQGDLSLGEIEQVSDEKTRETLRQAKLKYDPLTAEEVDAISARLQVNFDALFEKKSNGEIDYAKLRKEVSLPDILKVQSDHLDAFKNGILTKEKLITQASIIPAVLLEAVENKRQNRFWAVVDSIKRFNQVALAFTGGTVFNAAGEAVTAERKIRAELMDEYLEKFDKIDFEDPLAVAKAREDVVALYQQRRNENRRNLEVGDTIQTAAGPRKINFFHDDGEPDVNP